jgi:lipopolysaccharide biosynthesis glycosyltransferase
MALRLDELRDAGLYRRPMEVRDGQRWDTISGAPMATEFAISRFFVPLLIGYEGLALFMDCDMLVQSDICEVFGSLDPSKALMCIKHMHVPREDTKMDAQLQTFYARKNWSSFMLFNCAHPANKSLTLDLLNTQTGRALHAMCWLSDDLIGALPIRWNFLVGYSDPIGSVANLHFTLGTPDMEGCGNTPYADRWNREAEFLAAWQRRK